MASDEPPITADGDAVEGPRLAGGRSSFDGNDTRFCRGFIFPGPSWSGLDDEVIDNLLRITTMGDLAWVLVLTKPELG